MRDKTILASVLAANLVMILFFAPLVQASHGDNDTVVTASKDNRVVSFEVNNGINSEPIYGFIITLYHHGHFSEIPKTPDGWSAGRHGWHAVLWTTETHPIPLGTTETNFAIEVTRKGTYTIAWSVTDATLQPLTWGIITMDIS